MLTSPFELSPRSREEHHRAATPLELLFDLATVIAIASAAAGLHHAIADAHASDGILAFVFSFFAIWWAWMNYTWFASAYDDRSAWFRLLSMVIIFGALMMAAGIPALLAAKPYFLVWLGFVIMRLAQVVLWLQAARGDPARRVTAVRYAIGIFLAQAYWTGLFVMGTPGTSAFIAAFAVGMFCELAVPAIAEKANNTPWHRHHIVERYGLLTIIVLGESLLAASSALRRADVELSLSSPLLHIAVSAAVMTFAMWWAYFSREDHLETQDHRRAFQWGYGHVVVFAAAAAVLDIAPTREMYRDTTDAFARAYAHWFYLIEPAPFPERMIGAGDAAEAYWLKKCGLGSAGMTPFAPEALAEYLRCFRDPAMVHATCEDYRAAATIDIRHDDEDAGRKMRQPLLALWGRHGVIERCFDCLALWRERAENVTGEALPGGHYLAEELPDLVAEKVAAFMSAPV